ncbi:uncharacterized protein LOC118754611 [Rhagoletis pomonella]|uniref:uncharacterized protein LOC118751473 n=1 Tax=Rhagoletis pomonella TaxID=28610 RepID=UPI001783D3B0|nr:uncharacterized protein LOC118751473 [Rhagoletis pomonella]XP_036345393.1 uncharacterized protein LOC118754611 [Rhagoletis pomonella]
MVGISPDPVKGTITSGQFIMKIEELKQNYKWPEVMVLVAIQHKLKGMAKLWLDAQPVHSSWSDFVQAFYVDFPTGYYTAEVHKTMAKRKRKFNEDYVEFYYAMVTMGRQGAVDDLSIITHIISGLNDNSLSKTLAAIRFKSSSELLTALKNLKATNNPVVMSMGTTPTQQVTKVDSKVNARLQGKLAAKCSQPQRKPRSTSCSKLADEGTRNETTPVMKIIEVEGKRFNAFIDTGSGCSFIRKTAANSMQAISVQKRFIGFGGCKVEASEKVEDNTVMEKVQRQATLYIVEDQLLPYDVLLGRDVLQEYGFRIVVDDGVYQINEGEDNFNISKEREDICDIGRCKGIEMSIQVTADKPIVGKRYQVPFAQRSTLTDILRKLLDCGIIRSSNSPHAASVLLVKKSNGESRMCVDFRTLNEVTVKKNYIMPVVEEQLSRLAGNKYYTTLDMTSGYYQVPLAEESKQYTAFLTSNFLDISSIATV